MGECRIKIGESLAGDNLESCRILLEESGEALGRFHMSMSNIRDLPPDQKRWNSRNEKIEGLLRRNSFGGLHTQRSNPVQSPCWM